MEHPTRGDSCGQRNHDIRQITILILDRPKQQNLNPKAQTKNTLFTMDVIEVSVHRGQQGRQSTIKPQTQ